MPFDPKAYLKNETVFDPKKYIAEPVEQPKKTMLESALMGAAQGFTFGFADEIIGAASALKNKKEGESLSAAYKRNRDEARKEYDQASRDNPKSYMGGELTSALAPGSLVKKASGAAARVGLSAIGGATAAVGLSEQPEISGLVSDALKGAAVGGATGGLSEYVSRKVSSMAPAKLKEYAGERATKAAGAMKADMNALEKQGGVSKFGRKLMEEKIVTPFVSLEQVAERATAAKKEAGSEIGAILKNVDDMVIRAKQSLTQSAIPPAAKKDLAQQIDKEFKFNMQNVAKRIRTELIKPNSKNPLLKGEVSKLEDLAADFASQKPITLTEANVVKGTQGKVTKFASDTLPNAFKREVYDIIKTEMENVVAKTDNLEEGLSKLTKTPIGIRIPAKISPSEAYSAAKGKYATATQAEKIALNRLGAQRSNRQVSLTDTIAGSAGIAAGASMPQVIALGAINKFGRKYGASMQMAGAETLANILSSKPAQISGKYLTPILSAASKGPEALAAVHAGFMKDPNYRKELGEK